MTRLLLIPLIAIVYEDFKYRAIHWWWVVAIAVIGFFLREANFKMTLLNMCFVLIQFVGVSLYFSIKHRQFINVTTSFLGWGDIAFFLAVSFCFNPIEFIHFHIYSMIFTLIGFIIFQNKIKSQFTTIPLAGWMSIFLGICLNEWHV